MLRALSLESENIALFKSALFNFSEYLATEGIATEPYSQDSLAKFERLSMSEQDKLLKQVVDYYDECSYLIKSGHQLKDSRRSAQKVLESRGLRTTPGFFDMVDEDDILEVFNRDFTQIFRNVSFLRYNSYDLAQPWVTQWTDLYRRPKEIEDKLIERALFVLENPDQGCVHADLPVHVLEEVFSTKRGVFEVEQKLIAPVFDGSSSCVGLCATLSVKPLGSIAKNNSKVTILH